MASPQIKKEVEYFANHGKVKGKYPLSYHVQVLKDQKYYDRLWRETVKNMERDRFVHKFIGE